MERKITFVITNKNSKQTITSHATTLGELKREMDENHISYKDMDFMEGLTHTMLVQDDSILPSNIMYKNVYTNNLVIMLSNTQKKIKNGADIPIDRKSLYELVKANNLQSSIKLDFGMSYTNMTTKDLYNYISKKLNSNNTATPQEQFSISSRQEAYDYIKTNHLEKEIKDHYGKVYSSIKTDSLIDYVKSHYLATFVDNIKHNVTNYDIQDVEFEKSDNNGYTLAGSLRDVANSNIDKNVITIRINDVTFTDAEIDKMFQ